VEKLKKCRILRKITEILLTCEKHEGTASTFPAVLPHVMLINLNAKFAKVQWFWEDNSVAIITHENIHGVLYKLEGKTATISFDKLWQDTVKSRFLVDCDSKWFKWKEYKR